MGANGDSAARPSSQSSLLLLHSTFDISLMSESSLICEACHERPATHHLCEPHLERNCHLCKECFDDMRLPGCFPAGVEDLAALSRAPRVSVLGLALS